jgi:hypothetical protein
MKVLWLVRIPGQLAEPPDDVVVVLADAFRHRFWLDFAAPDAALRQRV